MEQRALQFSSQNPDIPTTMLEPHGLTYDLLLKPPHIRPATQLVDRFPLQKFVVDHIAKPDILGGELYEFAYYEYCGSDHAADMARLG